MNQSVNQPVRVFARGALWLLPVWAVMLFLGTLTHQPDPQTAFADFAAYVTTDTFLWSHLINSIAGAAIGSIGAIALLLYLQDSKAIGSAPTGGAIIGMMAMVAANTLNSSIFGVAAFAQTAMGRVFLAGQPNALEFYNQVYRVPLFATAVIALVLFMAGGVFMGLAIARSARFPRGLGWAFAVTTVGFVLSFFLFSPGQTLFSALLFITTFAIAWHALRADRQEDSKMVTSLGT